MSIRRKNRTLAFTVGELMESPRLKLAVELFDKDPLLMKAILTELALESLMVGKNTIIKKVNISEGMPKFALVPMLRSLDVDDFNTFNIYWGMSDIERKLYVAKVNGASKEELEKLVESVNTKLGVTRLMNLKQEEHNCENKVQD